MTPITYENVTDELVKHVPEFAPIYQKHLDYYEEIITYLLIAELIYMIRDLMQQIDEGGDSTSSGDVLKRIFDFIELCANADDDRVVSLAGAGFLESLHLTGQHYAASIARLGPTSHKLFDEMEAGWAKFLKWQSEQQNENQ